MPAVTKDVCGATQKAEDKALGTVNSKASAPCRG